jgi:hypothetical protein
VTDLLGPLLTATVLVAAGVALDPAPARVIRARVDARLAADTPHDPVHPSPLPAPRT